MLARENVNESLGFSSNELVFGHNVRGPLKVQWRPGIRPPHKADHPGIRTTFFQSQIFPHSHNVLSDSESGPTRDSGHGPPFFSPKS